ncbi:MAG: HupE/UreJ family protein [Myxococcaceae bacterium]|nr:HupE/UreJ family protein [Myxococcaceae bacterium]
MMTRSHALPLIAVMGLLARTVAPARAHPLSPPALHIRETSTARFDVTYRRSELAANQLTLDWPTRCRATLRDSQREADQVVDHLSLACTEALAGQTLRVFGLLELELSMLVHLQPLGSEAVQALLTPEHPSLRVPRARGSLEVVRDYAGLGIAHLLCGADHLLFLLGLLLIVPAIRPRLLTLTAFTLGHSVTLCLSALSMIRLPQAPVELGIAVSLLVLALEVLPQRAPRQGALPRACWVAGSFGLLHGLGFASALFETCLPSHAVPLALFGFNLGVELGQLLVVAALVLCLSLPGRLQTRIERHEQTWRIVSAYAIGGLATMWCIERALSVL